MKGYLGIIPCTKSKIWDYLPNLGKVMAKCAYTGPEYLLSKHLIADKVERIIIFSAKYGFMDPNDINTGNL